MNLYRYAINENGTALDTSTGFMWMRCAIGQTWDGKTCVGEPDEFTFDDACKQNGDGFAGYRDWRVPTIDELKTLVDKSQSGAKINPQAFPGALGFFVWSSSDHANYSCDAWGVDFSDGYEYSYFRSEYGHVRLVRGGQ